MTVDSVVYGDADGDGKVTAGDINHVLNWLIGRTPMPLAGTQGFVDGDVNGDAIVNLADVNLMIDLLLGRITKFPVE